MHAAPGRDNPRGRESLVPPRLRLAAVALVVACAALTASLGVWFADTMRAGRVDHQADVHLRDHFDDHLHIMRGLRELGSPNVVIVMCVVLFLVLAAMRKWRAAWLCILGPLAVGLTVEVLKPLLDRRIHGFLSYPSGHTAGAASVATIIALLALSPLAHGLRPGSRATTISVRVAAVVVAFGLVAGVAVAMVVLGNHYFTDTAGGFGLGVGGVIVVALLMDLVGSATSPRKTADEPADDALHTTPS